MTYIQYLPLFLQMRIPLFSTPVFTTLQSGGPIPPLSETIKSRVSSILSPKQERSFSIGSAPTSPQMQRRMTTSNLTSQQMMSSSLTSFDVHEVDAEYDDDGDQGPQSLQISQPSYFQRFSRSRCSQRAAPVKEDESSHQGPLRQICMDCKEMVLQVVRAQSTARRLQFAKSLFQQQLTSQI